MVCIIGVYARNTLLLDGGHPVDSDVNLETFVLFLSHTPARFYLSVELGFIVCFLHLCISAMHDITQL